MIRNRLGVYSLYALYTLALLATSAAAYHAGVRDGREAFKEDVRRELRKAFQESGELFRQQGVR